MKRAGIGSAVAILLAIAPAGADNEGTAEPVSNQAAPDRTEAVNAEGSKIGQPAIPDADYTNVIVPHASEPAKAGTQPEGIVERDSDDAIELSNVGEVVAIPKSAQKGMIPKDRWMDDRMVVGVTQDGRLKKKNVGVVTVGYVSKDVRFIFQGVEESIEIEGQPTTRPLLIVRTWADGTGPSVEERYPLAFKEVKSGQSRIEAGMELRGGVRAVAEGVSPGTYDVYLEIAVPGEDHKTVLVCGTFDEEGIPAVRNAASRHQGDQHPD